MVLKKMYNAICELPSAAKIPVHLGMTLGIAYITAQVMSNTNHPSVTPHYTTQPTTDSRLAQKVGTVPRTVSLEDAISQTTHMLEQCTQHRSRSSDVQISRQNSAISATCSGKNIYVEVSIKNDDSIAVSCYGGNCPTTQLNIFDQYSPVGANRFALTVYPWFDVPKGSAFEFHAPHPAERTNIQQTSRTNFRHDLSVYGALFKTPTLKASIDEARNRVHRLERR